MCWFPATDSACKHIFNMPEVMGHPQTFIPSHFLQFNVFYEFVFTERESTNAKIVKHSLAFICIKPKTIALGSKCKRKTNLIKLQQDEINKSKWGNSQFKCFQMHWGFVMYLFHSEWLKRIKMLFVYENL